MDTKLIVSASPHVRSEETTQSLMANVMIITNPDSGNIAETVERRGLGKIFRSEGELRDYALAEARMRKDVDFYRGRRAVLAGLRFLVIVAVTVSVPSPNRS